MQVRAIRLVLGVWLMAGTVLLAADFWKDKEFTAWSAHEVKEMLTDSPWARTVTVLTTDSSLAARVGGLSGGIVGVGPGSRSGKGAAGGGVGGDGAGNLGGGTFMASPLRTRVAVRWISALPVKLAMARSQAGANRAAAPDAEQSPPQDEPFYRIAVAGIPLELTEVLGGGWDLQETTRLKPRNRDAIPPVEISFTPHEGLLTIEFHFPRTDAITIDDGEVQFLAMLGDTKVKETFKLRDMVFRDRLTL